MQCLLRARPGDGLRGNGVILASMALSHRESHRARFGSRAAATADGDRVRFIPKAAAIVADQRVRYGPKADSCTAT
jgi:hypothetical protein